MIESADRRHRKGQELRPFDKIVPEAEVPQLLGELQKLVPPGSSFSVAAIQVLKNELEPPLTWASIISTAISTTMRTLTVVLSSMPALNAR